MAARVETGSDPADGNAPLVLALHSTWELVGAALMRGGIPLGERHLEGGRAAILLPRAVSELLAEAGVKLREIARIAVAVGPGSFTGIKVGLAAAFGLSRPSGISIVGVGSLEVLAEQVGADVEVTAMLPAGRGDLYVAVYGPREGQVRPELSAPRLLSGGLSQEPAMTDCVVHLGCESLLAGSGFERVIVGRPRELAVATGRLSLHRPLPEPGTLPAPVYLRRTWAEEVRDRAPGA